MNVPPGYARGHEPRGFGQLNVLLGYARGHGPQRFGRVNVSPGCVGATRAEIWKYECAAGPWSKTRAARFSHSVFAGPCVDAGSREIWSRECAGPVCEQGPGFSCVRVRVLACAGVSMRERVLSVRERVRGCTRACPSSCATRCPGCGGHMVGVLRGCACLLYTSPSPRDKRQSRMPSSA